MLTDVNMLAQYRSAISKTGIHSQLCLELLDVNSVDLLWQFCLTPQEKAAEVSQEYGTVKYREL